jgi:hypothetical protein
MIYQICFVEDNLDLILVSPESLYAAPELVFRQRVQQSTVCFMNVVYKFFLQEKQEKLVNKYCLEESRISK